MTGPDKISGEWDTARDSCERSRGETDTRAWIGEISARASLRKYLKIPHSITIEVRKIAND